MLDSGVSGGVLAVHADILLTTGVDPGCCSGVVVDKVRAAFGGVTLFPARGEFTCSGGGGSGGHHAYFGGIGDGLASGGGGGGWSGRVTTFFREGSGVESSSFHFCLMGLCCGAIGFILNGSVIRRG